MTQKTRREFLKSSVAIAAAPAILSGQSRAGRIRFAAIGLNHGHINGQVEAVTRGGGTLVSFFAKEPDLAAAFRKRYPDARLAGSAKEILEDPTIQLVVSASIPAERAPLGIEVMRHGKDFMVDKPGATTLEQLAEVRRVQGDTKRIFAVLVGRHESRTVVRATELIKSGAIGRVVQTTALAPHRMNPASRPSWFFERERYGGILCDLATHSVDEFLHFTGSDQVSVAAAQVGNVHHPQFPGLEDFGDTLLRGNRGTAYIRVDWFSPAGLGTWGDGRVTILGTDGYIELRKNLDIAGRPGGHHLFLVDQKETRHIDCSDIPLTWGQRLVDDVVNRTETANAQAQTFLAMQVTLEAQKAARQIT